MNPAETPRKNTREARAPSRRASTTLTMSGDSAIHANAGEPNLGKLAARSRPERIASG
jgi:hypothetical protein